MGEIFAGRYELIDQIAEGGMGTVWRVQDHKSERLVAAKLLRQSDAGSLLRFMREQGMRIEHNHVVTPLGWAGEDGRVIFTMPLIEGGSLTSLIKEQAPLPYPLVAELLRQILDGLAACHAAGIVHRDIKPGNILLEATGMGRPSAWITDFGIAVSVDAPRLTTNEMVLGTPGYMSPEQSDSADPHPLQDLYSAGVLGLQMLTGEHPGTVRRTRSDDVPNRPAGVPDVLWNLLVALADPDPARRPASASDALTWLALPEVAWHDNAARNIPNRLPPIETSGEFKTLAPETAAHALDNNGAGAPASLITHGSVTAGTTPEPTRNVGVPSSRGAQPVGADSTRAEPQRRSNPLAAWMAAPAALLVALVAAFAFWQPWAAGSGTSDPLKANIGGACSYADAGANAQTDGGGSATCTEKNGSYTWEKKD